MKSTIRISFSVIALFVLWTACKKNNSDTGNDRTTLLTSSTWKYDTAGVDFDHNGTIDLGDTTILACYKDNTYQFNKDSTGIANNGSLKCDDSEEQTFAFTWSYTGTTQSGIKSTANSLLAEGVNIFSVSSTKFVLYKDTTIFGTDLWYILQLKH